MHHVTFRAADKSRFAQQLPPASLLAPRQGRAPSSCPLYSTQQHETFCVIVSRAAEAARGSSSPSCCPCPCHPSARACFRCRCSVSRCTPRRIGENNASRFFCKRHPSCQVSFLTSAFCHNPFLAHDRFSSRKSGDVKKASERFPHLQRHKLVLRCVADD